jgi:hypothetical protein
MWTGHLDLSTSRHDTNAEQNRSAPVLKRRKSNLRSIDPGAALIFARWLAQSGLYFRLQTRAPEMEDGMRLWRAVLLTLLVGFCAAKMQAGPRVIIHDPDAPFPTPVGLTFTFNSDSSGGGILTFTNASGVNWFNLYIFVPPPDPVAAITCGGDTFANCVVLAGQNGYFATIAFTGAPGITNGEIFFADLGSSGWTPNAQFLAEANLPEPSTLLLLAGGIIPILMRKKWR